MAVQLAIFAHQPQYKAGAAILPRRVIKQSAAYTAIQSTGATDQPVGVSENFPKYAPIPQISSNPCAETGDAVPYRGEGASVEVDVGATATVAGGECIADSNGKIIPLGATYAAGTWVVGFTDQVYTAGSVAKLQVRIRQLEVAKT